MLNYVWLGLLILGVGVALTTDILESNENKYKNGEKLPVEIVFDDSVDIFEAKSYNITLKVDTEKFNDFYGERTEKEISQPATVTFNPEKKRSLLFFNVNEYSPSFWKEMAKISGKEEDLTGEVFLGERKSAKVYHGNVIFEEISFAHMKEVTNSALDYAGIAVEIAIGLIGIMALWLGVMKVAEDAGLIRIIANAMKPLTKFLFPDVPQDHPAMGAMIMNMACLLYTSPSPRDRQKSRMPSSA
jgi:spore maturation protein A